MTPAVRLTRQDLITSATLIVVKEQMDNGIVILAPIA